MLLTLLLIVQVCVEGQVGAVQTDLHFSLGLFTLEVGRRKGYMILVSEKK